MLQPVLLVSDCCAKWLPCKGVCGSTSDLLFLDSFSSSFLVYFLFLTPSFRNASSHFQPYIFQPLLPVLHSLFTCHLVVDLPRAEEGKGRIPTVPETASID